MDLDSADIQTRFRQVLRDAGIQKFNPLQAQAIEAGLLNLDSSWVVSAPTASGKTLLAELVMVKSILQKKQKAVYVVPLRALASEKYESFKERYGRLGINVGMSTGDFDSTDQWLSRYDIIILTSEKADSLMRHKAPWMNQIGVAVIDEVHLLNDPGRGPTLEVTIARLKHLNPVMRFLFLSATISNANELADWIGAKLIRSDWRPVKLKEGVYDGEQLTFVEKGKPRKPIDPEKEDDFVSAAELVEDNDGIPMPCDGEPPEIVLVDQTAEMGKQALIFAGTRRNAEAIAEKAGGAVKKHLKPEEKEKLEKLAHDLENVLDSPTKQCRRLAKMVRDGSAFHHAGLVGRQRSLLEHAFRDRLVKIIAATPTLAMGVDLPAYRVIIRDAKRFAAGYGYAYIPVLEYEQMRGRAGRPRWDTQGESILVSHNRRETDELIEHFVMSEPEEITSKLAVEPVLRMHTLALVATEDVRTEKELLDFYLTTFWGHQFNDPDHISEMTRKILAELADWGFVVRTGRELKPTQLGKRVSELYIDPDTAHIFIEALENYKVSPFGLLQLMASTPEMAPQPSVSDREMPDIESALEKRGQFIMGEVPEQWDVDFENFVGAVKIAIVLENWVHEVGEDALLAKYKMSPGELHVRLENVDWLLYALDQLAELSGKRIAQPEIRKLRLRAKYGIKEELLPLVRIKGIGRVRARLLFNAGVTDTRKLRALPAPDLAKLVGPAVAKGIREQLEAGTVKKGFDFD
ncbi:MAG: DEAD/DEAH box helicase [Candidatus Aenigmatarchaeota archaeon]